MKGTENLDFNPRERKGTFIQLSRMRTFEESDSFAINSIERSHTRDEKSRFVPPPRWALPRELPRPNFT